MSGNSMLSSPVELGPQPGELVSGCLDLSPGGEPGQLAVEFGQLCGGLVEGGLLPAALLSELLALG